MNTPVSLFFLQPTLPVLLVTQCSSVSMAVGVFYQRPVLGYRPLGRVVLFGFESPSRKSERQDEKDGLDGELHSDHFVDLHREWSFRFSPVFSIVYLMDTFLSQILSLTWGG